MFSQSFLYGPRCSTLSHLWPDRLLLNACYSRWPQINIGTSASRIMQVCCCNATLNQKATERKKRAGEKVRSSQSVHDVYSSWAVCRLDFLGSPNKDDCIRFCCNSICVVSPCKLKIRAGSQTMRVHTN